MLKAYINNSCVPITNRQKYYIEYQYDGQQTLSFSLPASDDLNKELQEEVQIEEDDENRFLIKKINRVGNYVDYTCELDMDEFKLNVYKLTKDLDKFQTKSLLQIITAVLPEGWSVLNANIRDIKRTIELEGATDYDVLFKCEEIFDIVFEINNLAKTIRVIDPKQFEYTGLYIHRDLNLKSYTMKGDSSNIITRLYCEGKDGLTFAAINNGKDYVENLSYKNKVLSARWKDERYTVAESLLADGKKKLDDLAVPSRSYIFNVVDLANLNETYDFLAFHLYQPVKVIIDENLSILNRVIKYRKYIDDNEKSQNIVTLSNEPQTLKNVINNALGGDIKNPVKGNFLDQAQKESAAIIEEFAKKGHRYETDNETYFLDALPKEKAKYVMRMNLGGIAFSQNGWAGPYTTAWTIDGKFNADFIAAGTLQAIKISGGSINIGNGTFVVDSNGNLKMTKGSINIGKKFIVDENGNLTVDGNGKFVGEVSGSTIRGSNIVGSALSSQSGTLLVSISNGKLTFINSKNSTLIDVYAADVVITQGDDITGKGDLVFDSSITSKAQIQSVGNLYSNKNAQIAKICYAQKFQNISDIRKKENVENIDLTGIFDYVDIKKFNYINDIEKSVGVIAQDFIGTPYEDIILRKDTQGYYTIDYNVFALACIQKNQQLEKRLDSFVDILKSKGVLE